ncbi:hypothetical protein TSOC_012718 [Tetrabaena socialis]|uniref:Pherophorin domain-containing protein n=1 Tax=Tetrabaena socialis TaxID=47790 RepID=A0A2J7ZMC3_9CHLO|nr:hypothetical protein TSOC_012718 [Tetrabaena socialis]|eukprot:PNH01400.1 hypothetical protein TSOC_012718 [Tetrabaena socialis]
MLCLCPVFLICSAFDLGDPLPAQMTAISLWPFDSDTAAALALAALAGPDPWPSFPPASRCPAAADGSAGRTAASQLSFRLLSSRSPYRARWTRQQDTPQGTQFCLSLCMVPCQFLDPCCSSDLDTLEVAIDPTCAASVTTLTVSAGASAAATTSVTTPASGGTSPGMIRFARLGRTLTTAGGTSKVAHHSRPHPRPRIT